MTPVRVAAAVVCMTIAPLVLVRAGERAAQPSAKAPAPNADHAVGFFDERRQRVVLVGGPGDARSDVRDRVWSWSGTAWELVTDAGPPGRTNAAAAYDRRRSAPVVAGGSQRSARDDQWQVVGDTWSGERDGWRRIGDIAARDHHALVADGEGTVMMFGGIPADRSGPWPSDTWALRGDRWERLAVDGPPGRGRTALAYDAARRQVVLFGGASAPPGPKEPQTFLDDTWVWERGSWRRLSVSGPRGRYAHAMVFDERAGVVLLYSGSAAHSNAPLTDMWQWDGSRWSEIPLTGPTPGHRYQPVVVYDRARGRTVLFGGIGGQHDTWEWDGQRWQLMP